MNINTPNTPKKEEMGDRKEEKEANKDLLEYFAGNMDTRFPKKFQET